MAAPGYPRTYWRNDSTNYDRGLTAFIVGDSPATLDSSGTSLNEWGTNVALAVEDNSDGLVSRDEYLGVYYPWALQATMQETTLLFQAHDATYYCTKRSSIVSMVCSSRNKTWWYY